MIRERIYLISKAPSIVDSNFANRFAKLPTLKAAESGRVAVIAGPEIYSTGPMILELVDTLKHTIDSQLQTGSAPQ